MRYESSTPRAVMTTLVSLRNRYRQITVRTQIKTVSLLRKEQRSLKIDARKSSTEKKSFLMWLIIAKISYLKP